MIKPTSCMCAQWRLRSAWASAQSDQSLLSAWRKLGSLAWVLSYPMSAQRRFWSDWVDAQADLSLRWTDSHFVGFVMLRLISCWQDFNLNFTKTHNSACTNLPEKKWAIHIFDILACTAEVLEPTKSVTESWTNGLHQANLVLIAYASSEGSGEPAHPRSLARTFAARSYKQWVKRNPQTESQIPGPSEWLGMRS